MQSLKQKPLDELKRQQQSLMVEVHAQQMKSQGNTPQLAEAKFALSEVTKAITEKESGIIKKGLGFAPSVAPSVSLTPFIPSRLPQPSPVTKPVFAKAVAPTVSFSPFVPSTLPQPSPVTRPVFPSGKAVNVMPSVDPSVYSPQIDGDPVTQTLLTRQEKILEFIQDNLLYIGIGVLVGGYLVFKPKKKAKSNPRKRKKSKSNRRRSGYHRH